MISKNSVLALNNSFVTVERLIPPQILRGVSDTPLLKIFKDIDSGILIETQYYSIVTSPHQQFIVSPTELMESRFLEKGDEVLTIYGFMPVTLSLMLNGGVPMEMANIVTKSGIFLSEGFYLISE